jgi:hypothetical protein
MSGNCSCKKCCNPCYDPCNPCPPCDPCVLLVEPCNPCPPKCQTISYCVPSQSCPTVCPPSGSNIWLCPQYVVYTAKLASTVTALTAAQVNSYNMFVFGGATAITLPVVSTLNNGGKKTITLTNPTTSDVTVTAGATDDINGNTAAVTISSKTSLTLTSIVGMVGTSTGTTWAAV